jgi:transposase
MIGLVPGTKVFLACRPIDLRAGFDGLSAKVQQIIGADPFSGHVFIFRSKRGQRATFCIWFSIRDDRLPLASAVRADVPGITVSTRQGADVHLHGRTA